MTDTKKVIFGGIECDAAKASALLLEITPMAIRVAESLAKDGCTKEKIAEGTAAAVDAVVRALVEIVVENGGEAASKSESANHEGQPGVSEAGMRLWKGMELVSSLWGPGSPEASNSGFQQSQGVHQPKIEVVVATFYWPDR
ncbi:hypothetical protein [Serratia fonticola]